jgi:hypothetical protein
MKLASNIAICPLYNPCNNLYSFPEKRDKPTSVYRIYRILHVHMCDIELFYKPTISVLQKLLYSYRRELRRGKKFTILHFTK